jgi:hypothetical protein
VQVLLELIGGFEKFCDFLIGGFISVPLSGAPRRTG